MLAATSRCILTLAALAAVLPAQRRQPPKIVDTETIKHVQIRSKLLSDHFGRPITMDAGVVLPPGHDSEKERLPVCYSIHGFGGSHASAWRRGPRLVEAMQQGDYPRMIYVFLNAKCPLGHHTFADSANNGPVGTALVQELIPAIERRFGAYGKPRGRFLTGHSSGGWASLWVQLNHPNFFNGTWSTAPDSVDFRDFTGINVYGWKNAYVDPEGKPIQLVRRNGKFVRTFQQFAQREHSRQRYGGQIASFDAVFSPRGEDGRPAPMFDRDSGAIDPVIAKTWRKYDITDYVKRNWRRLKQPLAGKVHVYMGTQDTFRLEGALYLFAKDMTTLGANFDIRFVEGRDHGSLFRPHPTLWPKGMLEHIHRAMLRRFATTAKAPAKQSQSHTWTDARKLRVEGQAFSDTAAPYDRLPARAAKSVRKPVWRLSQDSAGIAVRFRSDAPEIRARWTLRRPQLAMPHMPATGVSGLDLYVREDGRWQWLGVGMPRKFPNNEARLAGGMKRAMREYLLYLPLYNGVLSLAIGVPKGCELAAGAPPKNPKPIVFYGTSITQGGCASRPGMVHTAILGRQLDRTIINLGFSGNGTMDASMATLLAEIDAAAFVIDCLPNMQAKQVAARTAPLLAKLRQAHPDTPIFLVEDRSYTNAFAIAAKAQRNATSRKALRDAFAKLRQDPALHYIEGATLLGADGEGTVDSSHPTDLGFLRQARAFAKHLTKVLR